MQHLLKFKEGEYNTDEINDIISRGNKFFWAKQIIDKKRIW